MQPIDVSIILDTHAVIPTFAESCILCVRHNSSPYVFKDAPIKSAFLPLPNPLPLGEGACSAFP